MSGNVFTRGLSRISGRKKRRRELPAPDVETSVSDATHLASTLQYHKPSLLGRGMDRLRRSIRQSLRRRRSSERTPVELGTPAIAASSSSSRNPWQPDEMNVRTGACSFQVKYLGAVEVYESRGISVCEGALKVLRNSRRRPVKALLYVSGDGLRVVDLDNNRGLIVDQTIEKVSFCAPDHTNPKGFAYICRDGTTRRWMCHGFHASKDTGERISHAVGCAFAICLERKRRREEDASEFAEKSLDQSVWNDKSTVSNGTTTALAAVTLNTSVDVGNGMQRTNNAYQSFRKQISISERLQDPQAAIVNEVPAATNQIQSNIAKPRPQPNPALFQRQGSLRAPEAAPNSSFRRNLSLREGAATTSFTTSPNKMSFYNEPIYEGDEEHLIATSTSFLPPSSITAPASSTSSPMHSNITTSPLSQFNQQHTQPLMPIGLNYAFGSPGQQPQQALQPKPTLMPLSPQLITAQQPAAVSNVHTGFSPMQEQWPSNSSNVAQVVPMVQRQRADAWLEDTLKKSLSLTSPTSPTSSSSSRTPLDPLPTNVATRSVVPPNGFANGFPPSSSTAQSSYSLISLAESPVRAAPPSHPPPPLPSKNAVCNGGLPHVAMKVSPNAVLNGTSSSSSSIDVFNQPAQWDQAPVDWSSSARSRQLVHPEDPFDIRWSQAAAMNPFHQKEAALVVGQQTGN